MRFRPYEVKKHVNANPYGVFDGEGAEPSKRLIFS